MKKDRVNPMLQEFIIVAILFSAFLFLCHWLTNTSFIGQGDYCKFRFGEGYRARGIDRDNNYACVYTNNTDGVQTIKYFDAQTIYNNYCRSAGLFNIQEWGAQCTFPKKGSDFK